MCSAVNTGTLGCSGCCSATRGGWVPVCVVFVYIVHAAVESLINTRTLKKRCALAARTEVKQTQELYVRWANV